MSDHAIEIICGTILVLGLLVFLAYCGKQMTGKSHVNADPYRRTGWTSTTTESSKEKEGL